MNHSTKQKNADINLIKKLFSVFVVVILFLAVTPVYAASLTALSDTMSRIAVSVDANHTIQFTTPTGVAAGQTITITFPSDFDTTSVDYTDIDVTDDGAQLTIGATASGSTWGAVFGGTGNRTLTITSGTGTIAGTSVVVVKIGTHTTQGATGDQAINNPSTDGTKVITIAGTFGDTGSIAVAIADGTYDDQFTVSATVDPSITFTLNDNAVNLGTLSISSVSTDTTSFVVNTNANSGYSVYAYEDGNLRYSSYDIDDVLDSAVTAGSEEYGMSTSKAGQQFAQTSGNAATRIESIANQKICASALNPVNNDSTTLTLHASVSGTTPAGLYSHIVTLIATGNF